MCLEVWMWVHKKYGIIWTVIKLYSIESNDYNHLAAHNYVVMNIQSDVAYDLQRTNGKIFTTWNIVLKVLQLISNS